MGISGETLISFRGRRRSSPKDGESATLIDSSAPKYLVGPLIQHAVVEMFDLDVALLDDEAQCRTRLLEFVRTLDVQIVTDFVYKFKLGVSAVIVITESHVALHTWPEFGYAHIDIFTCSPQIDFAVISDDLRAIFGPGALQITRLDYSNNLPQLRPDRPQPPADDE